MLSTVSKLSTFNPPTYPHFGNLNVNTNILRNLNIIIQSKTIVTPVTITITDLNSNTTYKQIISGLPINLNLSSIHAGVYILSVYDPKINFKVCYKLLKL